jgi:two-component system NtrC family sensor kinase
MAATPENFAHPEFLVETEWLAAHLGRSDLRILDCTVHIVFNPVTMFEISSGGADFEHGHIPGAQFVDVLSELSDASHPVPLMAPGAAQFASVMTAHGVGDGNHVVLYSAQNVYWATRVWWLFRMFGFDDAAVLNGGLQKWRREARPIETGPARLQPPARFIVREQHPLMASKTEVLAAIGDSAVCMINALPDDQHRFTSGIHYGRPGHIKGSVSLPSDDLLDPQTNEFLPAGELRRRFDRIRAFNERVITYCGGGAAASADAMALVMLGHPNVKLYDGSLLEWATDPSLPMDVDPVPVSPDQAVIAIENRRLLDELREALAQQAAMSEILQVINSSPGNLAPVFDAVMENSMRLCEATQGHLYIYADGQIRAEALRGEPHFVEWQRRRGSHPVTPGSPTERALHGEQVIHVADATQVETYRSSPAFKELIDRSGIRTGVTVALRKDEAFLGTINVYRQEVRPFTDKQIALLQNFAAQAVIAMENARLLTETREALEQQTATADVLQVINSSPGDLAPVFDATLEKAMRLCEAAFGLLTTFDGEAFHAAALHGVPAVFAESWREPRRPGPGLALYRLTRGENVVHIPDVTAEEAYRSGDPIRRALADLGGARTGLWVALRKDAALLGAFVIYRKEVRPFSDKQIVLLQNFAAQAVIAMENARLLTETREALEQQTATAEVLGVINSSPGDLAPVFDAILEKAHTLCGATLGGLAIGDGEQFRFAAMHAEPDIAEAWLQLPPRRPAEGTPMARLMRAEQFVHLADVLAEDAFRNDPLRRRVHELAGVRTLLLVPLRKDGTLLGALSAYRKEVRPFTDKQIALLQNFAAQAVIAIENTRLITETREALEQQTATAEVLQVINSSPGDLAPVFDAMLEKAIRLCQASGGALRSYEGEAFHPVAMRGVPAEFWEATREVRPDPATALGRIEHGEHVVQVTDLTDPKHPLTGTLRRRQMIELGGIRTALWVALRQDDTLRGTFVLYRGEVRPFSEKQIALVESFAAQAVIAMDNARLLNEIRQRQAELRVTFDNMGDGVAMFDSELRLAAWNQNFQRILDLPDALLAARPSYADYIRFLAERGEFGADTEAALSRRLDEIGQEMRFEHTRPDGRVIEVRRNAVPGGGFVVIYSDITERKRAEAEIRAARDTAEKALQELQTAQASLLHAQKMAALGQLTAGIAHEIKNPLNFVNNFAELSGELLLELKEMTAPAVAALGDEERAAVDEVVEMLRGNLDKIAEHGKRADGIVKSMLEHSRGVSGERRAVDLNALIEEALNLAYHGARAQDQNFNITLECELAHSIAPIELVPQDMTRVFLNLFGNGFYAAAKRRREAGEANFRPVLKVTTRDLGDAVEVRVRDNGTGIAPEIRDKLFQPFVTTKPTGEGTGLGLSISWDIVTQQHGGRIDVDSRVGEFTEFRVRLPRTHWTAAEAAS